MTGILFFLFLLKVTLLCRFQHRSIFETRPETHVPNAILVLSHQSVSSSLVDFYFMRTICRLILNNEDEMFLLALPCTSNFVPIINIF